jgi:RES domain-containing protein
VVHDPALLDALEHLETKRWRSRVFRHMLGSAPPERANRGGARWNPPEVAALYTSTTAETAKAEGDHLIASQSVPPRASRTIYELEVVIANLLDLTNDADLAAVGIDEDDLDAIPWESCQRIGGAVAWLEHDGLLVPSIRDSGGTNLVIFTSNQPPEAEIQICGKQEIQ